ncbi:EpsG family protein [Pseudoalteromonas sp. SWN166]|uniref:EpsG family protein n=1 Tax=Pseudoalteromonas sp. SWN166 TaxID=2792061 RepID=UPI0018CDA3B5|nr:EpsG family protein [Pseudoalteromonas sp. SWN166]MBH0038958.1 EpsG family protein [Pseudoalteromonas sp. SWN166]
MIFYFFITILLFSILYLASRKKSKYQSICYFLFFAILFLLAGLRGDVGQDTYSYQLQYDSLIDLENLFLQLRNAEPVLYLIMYPYKLIFDDLFGYTGFLLVISFLQILLLSYATKNMYHRSFFLAVYLTIFYLQFHFNILRASFAVLFFLCSLRVMSKSSHKSIIFYILALCSHLSSLIFLPILLCSLKIKLRYYMFFVILFILVGVGGFVIFGDLVQRKVENYDLLNLSAFEIPLGVVCILLISWFSFFCSENISLEFYLTLLLFSLALFAYSFSDIAYRVYYILLVVLFYFSFERKVFNISSFKFEPHILSVFLLCLWFSFFSVRFIVNEKYLRNLNNDGLPEFSYSPYSLYNSSKYRTKGV